MSARDSSDESALAIAMLAGPILALTNQLLIYTANMWTCGHGMRHAAQVIPVLCLVVTIAAGMIGYRARRRFLGISAVATSVFSALVILAQWSAILAFDPCMRA